MTVNQDRSPDDAAGSSQKRFRVPIATLLVLGFGTLTLVAVASVLYLGIYSGGRNTVALLTDKAELVQEAVESRIREQFGPAERQAAYLVDLMAGGAVDVSDEQRLLDTMRGALAATPQVTGIGYVWPDGRALRVGQFAGEIVTVRDQLPAEDGMRMAMEDLRGSREAYWGAPVWVEDMKATLLTHRSPVEVDGRFAGGLFIAITLTDLSRFLDMLSEGEEIEAVVLSGREYVIAHKNLARMAIDYSDDRDIPLPRIDEVNDPVIAQMWEDGDLDEAIAGGHGLEELGIVTEVVRIGNRGEYFQVKEIPGYGPSLWMTVIHFPVREVGEEFLRLIASAVVGVVLLILAVIISLMIGRMLARRIRIVAAAAQSLQNLDFENAPKIPDSRFQELALAARAFNTMVTGLRWFETYVPKTLVLKLMHGGSPDALAFQERPVTIMFTDIRGFSALARSMDARETATLLNEHFALIGDCIEAEGGTVDKFIGDAVMAFWGAPDDQPDHAARALRAAKAMAAVVERENERRVAAGEVPVAMRVAIHSGPVVVGNIGSKDRINYTIVGDPVNTAARIEELAAGLHDPDSDWIVLASADTIAAAGEEGFVPIGRRHLRGLAGDIALYGLNGRYSHGQAAAAAGND